jgi:hypothetical protein
MDIPAIPAKNVRERRSVSLGRGWLISLEEPVSRVPGLVVLAALVSLIAKPAHADAITYAFSGKLDYVVPLSPPSTTFSLGETFSGTFMVDDGAVGLGVRTDSFETFQDFSSANQLAAVTIGANTYSGSGVTELIQFTSIGGFPYYGSDEFSFSQVVGNAPTTLSGPDVGGLPVLGMFEMLIDPSGTALSTVATPSQPTLSAYSVRTFCLDFGTSLPFDPNNDICGPISSITRISSTGTVPEPTTFLLLGSVLVFAARHWRRSASH